MLFSLCPPVATAVGEYKKDETCEYQRWGQQAHPRLSSWRARARRESGGVPPLGAAPALRRLDTQQMRAAAQRTKDAASMRPSSTGLVQSRMKVCEAAFGFFFREAAGILG